MIERPSTILRESATRRIGTTVADRYVVQKLVGLGGMGAVYLAEHRVTRRQVALKLMHPNAVDTKNAERLLREAQAASAIGHPGIVEVLDAGNAADGQPYVVFELLAGEDLGAAIEGGHLVAATVLHAFVDVLDALAAAHALGIVHRDIKPENIFLARGNDSNLRVKLLDFGIATATEAEPSIPSLTSSGMVLGTPYYMSPEQARGEKLDGRSDLWSVGATMFHALTGRPPHDSDNYNVVVAQLLAPTRVSLGDARPDLPAEVIAVIDRALSKNVGERWESAVQMRAALLAAIPSLDGLADRASPTPFTVAISSSADTMASPPGSTLDPATTNPRLSSPDALTFPLVLKTVRAPTPIALDAHAPARSPTLRTPRARWLAAASLVTLVALGTGAAVTLGNRVAQSAPSVAPRADTVARTDTNTVAHAASPALVSTPAPAIASMPAAPRELTVDASPVVSHPVHPVPPVLTAVAPVTDAPRASPATAPRHASAVRAPVPPHPAARVVAPRARVIVPVHPTPVPHFVGAPPAPSSRRAIDIVRVYE